MEYKVLLCLLLTAVAAYADDKEEKVDAASFLTKFGYLSLSRSGNHDARTAIKRYQKFMHLEQTGDLDEATLKEMKKPRCGNADVDESGDRVRRYKTGSKWRRTTLTYRFLTRSEDMSHDKVKAIIREAFGHWSRVTPLRFTETTGGSSDFTIGFYRRSHGDGAPFDGRSGVLAHAYFPENGRIHFDEDEYYHEKDEGINLLWVAVHEIGHAIGLHHSNVRGTIMWPSYSGYKPNLQLHSDDIAGIQSLYGRGSGGGGGGGGGGGACQDKDQRCRGWTGYCSSNDYVKQNCKQTCGYCGGGGGTSPGPGPGCRDNDSKCPGWTGYCRNNDYVRQNCKKTCGYCSGGGGANPGPGPSCRDNDSKCTGWTRYCANNGYVQKNCRKTCRRC